MRAFVFPGQGSQYSGMAKDFSVYESAKGVFERARKVLGFDITEIMDGDEETLKLTENAQPAIFVTSYIAFLELEKRNILPDVVAGHSLGEYTALAASGVYDFETGLYLVRKRGEYMSKALEPGKGTMAAVIGLDLDVIEEVVRSIDGVFIANYNSQDQVVISGLKEGVELAMERLKEKGAKRVVELMVSSPFHTPFLEYARKKMEEEVAGLKFNKPRWPIVMNVTARPTQDPEEIKENLIAQITGSVLWKQSVDTLKSMGVKECVEVGPKTVLKNLCKRMEMEAKHFTEVIG